MSKKILFAASECAPFVKTGGLADVAAALPVAALSRLANTLPLGSIGFGWVLPALAGFGIGLLCKKAAA